MPHLEEQELSWTDLDKKAVDTVRVLAADAVEKVGNGHPGTAMSLAPAAYLLFQKLMRHDPKNPDWLGRDRFVLSPGHTSLTLYIQLFLSGYGLELKDLEALRTWGGSLTPGPPGVQAHRRCGNHHRPAGPGPGLGCWFRLLPASPTWPVRRRCSRRRIAVRPHHLGYRFRR